MRLSQSISRCTSRISGQAWAMSWCASSTGWACCMWVRPGITVRPAFSLCSIRALTRSSRSPAITREWRRSHIRIRQAIWSLRERPALSLPPSSSPAMLSRPRSSAVASSSSSSIGAKTPESTRRCSSSSADSMRLSSSSVSRPARPSARAWAREPAISSSARRQSNWVDLDRRASSAEGPELKRPPHRARCCSDALFSVIVPTLQGRLPLGSLELILRRFGPSGRRRNPAFGSGVMDGQRPASSAWRDASAPHPPETRRAGYSTVLDGTSMPLPNLTSRAAATRDGRP